MLWLRTSLTRRREPIRARAGNCPATAPESDEGRPSASPPPLGSTAGFGAKRRYYLVDCSTRSFLNAKLTAAAVTPSPRASADWLA